MRLIGSSTLRVYLEMLKSGTPMGVRELKRKLGFSSPGAVKYHLDKLLEVGLVIRHENGTYEAVRNPNHILSLFIFIKGHWLPRTLPISMAFFAFASILLILTWPPSLIEASGLTALMTFSIYNVWEGFRTLKLLMRYL